MITEHIVSSVHNHKLQNDSTLHVIGVCSNPVRWHSRYRLAREWIQAMLNTPHVELYVVETAFGDRHYEVTESDHPRHLQLRTRSECWIKESMINLGVRYLLPRKWKYVAWVDMDVFFEKSNWAIETMHALQRWAIIQPWSDCMDQGPHGETVRHFKSFGAQHQKRVPKQKHPSQKEYQYAHSGFAWACTRRFWEASHGLMDFAILGSADHHMAFGCIGEVVDTVHGKMSLSFKRKCKEWELRAARACHKQVGFIPGTIKHKFHGPKARRYYRERWEILYGNGFCPDTHVSHDEQGLVTLVGHPKLEHDIKDYNNSRLEDSIEVY